MPGCRPTKAEVAGLSAQLDQVLAQQKALDERIAQLEVQEAATEERAEIERTSLVQGINGVAERLAELEKREAAKPMKPAAAKPDPAAVYKVTLGDSHVKGRADALVTIVMWTDYQCPYSARVQATLAQLEREYGRELRLVHKHNPLGFHPHAMPAALAAEAAGRQDAFWKMHAILFEHQKELEDASLRKWAKKLGLDSRRFEKDVGDPALRQRIEAEQEQGVTLGARGTPAFFVNGRFLSGAQPIENFKALIDEERAKARVLVERGVRPEQVYEVTIAEGRTKL